MIKELIKLATHLDSKGFTKEADFLDSVIEEAKDEYRPPVPRPAAGMYGGPEESRFIPMPKDMICGKVRKMTFELFEESASIFKSMYHHCEDDPEELEQCAMHARKIRGALDEFLKFCSDDKMNIL